MYDSGRTRRGAVFHSDDAPLPPLATTRSHQRDDSSAHDNSILPFRHSSPPPRTPHPPSNGSTHARRAAGDQAHPHARQEPTMPVEPEPLIQGWRDRGKLGPRTRQPQYTGAPSLGPRRPRNSAGGVGFKFSRVENTGERRGGRGEDSRTQQPEPKRTAFGTTSKGEGPQAATGAHHQGWAQLEGHRTDMPCKGVMIPVGSGVHAMWPERRRPGGAAAEPHNMQRDERTKVEEREH